MNRQKGQLWLRLADVPGVVLFCTADMTDAATLLLESIQQVGGKNGKARGIKDLLGARAPSVASSSTTTWEMGYVFAIGFVPPVGADVRLITFDDGSFRISSGATEVQEGQDEACKEATDAREAA